MCGIAAVVSPQGSSPRRDELVAMLQKLAHRGPDDFGIDLYQNVGLGHRRLSIIDLSSAGHQPMRYEHLDRVIFNGELYNSQSRLRARS